MMKIVHLTLGSILLLAVVRAAHAEVVIAGLAPSHLEPQLAGLVLIEELNCTACHTSEAPITGRSKKSPRLSAVGSRLNPSYIEAFIGNPHATKPSTTMPDMLSQMSDAEKRQTAKSITHFLLSRGKSDFSLQPPDAVAAQHGERLFHSRGCAACHSPRDTKGTELLPKTSAPLGALDKKYSYKSLVEFLRQPLASRPSGRMPDLRLQGQDADRIAHYLLRDTRVPGSLAYTTYRGAVWEGIDSDKVEPERAGYVSDFALANLGTVRHQTAIKYEGWLNIPKEGRYTFSMVMNGGSLHIDDKELIVQQPSNGRRVKNLEGAAQLATGWRKIVATCYQTGYDPKFSLEMEGPEFKRQAIPSSMLSVSDKPIAAFEPLRVDAELAGRGQVQFEKLGCARCHDDVHVTSKPALALSKLDAGRGCLGETAGPWPRFDLSAEQRKLIAAALPKAEQPLNDRHRLDTTLVAFNCIACHDRAGLGGIAPERNARFTGTHEALGDQGRLPPPLTHVGAKLNPEWITEVLLRGKRQRDYLDASMPQFGQANVGHLVELFGKLDALETVTYPKIANLPESKKAGHEMMGVTGLGCIACHDFNGQKAGGPGALDIVSVTERLKKDWFHLYLRQPSRFHPTVIMPAYWPGGVSTRPSILGGDTSQQIEALWVYLEDGPRAKKPVGLSRQSRELRVGDVAEICRGRGPVGYRGIGVGYPQGLNLAFDSEQMALRLLWKGEFANVDLGSFEPRGSDRISLPTGIPFHRLKSMEDNWPYKGKTNYPFPQDHGYQFRGYSLDALRRPTFRYTYGDITVEDFFEDVRDKDGNIFFKRTFRFDTPAAQPLFHFRAAAGKKIATPSERVLLVDQLRLRITSDHKAVVREGDPGDVLIPLTLPQGKSTLTLEYQW